MVEGLKNQNLAQVFYQQELNTEKLAWKLKKKA